MKENKKAQSQEIIFILGMLLILTIVALAMLNFAKKNTDPEYFKLKYLPREMALLATFSEHLANPNSFVLDANEGYEYLVKDSIIGLKFKIRNRSVSPEFWPYISNANLKKKGEGEYEEIVFINKNNRYVLFGDAREDYDVCDFFKEDVPLNIKSLFLYGKNQEEKDIVKIVYKRIGGGIAKLNKNIVILQNISKAKPKNNALLIIFKRSDKDKILFSNPEIINKRIACLLGKGINTEQKYLPDLPENFKYSAVFEYNKLNAEDISARIQKLIFK